MKRFANGTEKICCHTRLHAEILEELIIGHRKIK